MVAISILDAHTLSMHVKKLIPIPWRLALRIALSVIYMRGTRATPILVFVYNADSGFFNLLSDMAHKAFSPDTYNCQLCKLTHGYFGMREQWQQYLESLDAQLVFLHRDEFIKQYGRHKAALPALFIDCDGVAELFMSEETINACESLDVLIEQLDAQLNSLE